MANGLTDLTVDLSASVFADSLGNDIPVTATKGEFHVAPEPSALGLVLVALGGIVVLRSGIRSRR